MRLGAEGGVCPVPDQPQEGEEARHQEVVLHPQHRVRPHMKAERRPHRYIVAALRCSAEIYSRLFNTMKLLLQLIYWEELVFSYPIEFVSIIY